MKAGLYKDAHKAYDKASATSGEKAQERVLSSELFTQPSLEASSFLHILKDANENAFWLFLQGLCFLAKEPSEHEAAQTMLEQARQAGLPSQFEELGGLLCALAVNDPDGRQQICTFLDEGKTEMFPPTLRLGLKILGKPEGLNTLKDFKEQFGTHWKDFCPIFPEEILGLKLRNYYDQSDSLTALHLIQETETLNIDIPREWKAFLHICQAIQFALTGNFESAKIAQQQAFENLPIDKQEEEEHGEDI